MQIESLSVTFHGHELVADSTLELNYGRYAIYQVDSLIAQASHEFIESTTFTSRHYYTAAVFKFGLSTSKMLLLAIPISVPGGQSPKIQVNRSVCVVCRVCF